MQAQIAEKEDRLNELSGPLLETKLPDETLLKIFGYLSSYDVLRNVARVSKKFKKLSEDPFLIRHFDTSDWTEDQMKGCLKVLQRSQNLRVFSFDLKWNYDGPAYQKFLEALPTFIHSHLKEFCFKVETQYNCDEISLIRKLMKYLQKCSNLKILKIEYDGAIDDDNDLQYNNLLWFVVKENIFSCLQFQNLEELHLQLNAMCSSHVGLCLQYQHIINMFDCTFS